MKLILALSLFVSTSLKAEPYRSLQELGLSPTNSGAANKIVLRKSDRLGIFKRGSSFPGSQ